MASPIAVFATSDGLDQHLTPDWHPERPGRLDAALKGIPAAGLSDAVTFHEPRLASVEELSRVHDASYVAGIERFCGAGGGDLDPDTYAAPGSWTTARLAAGAVLDSVEALRNGTCEIAFAAGRPPGHHAVPDRAMGFCLFNNVSVAAAKLADEGQRVAIVDWDVHHGNGTQDIFYDDPRVLYVSTHEAPLYPGTGRADETGTGAAIGTKLNIPLPPQADDALFEQIWFRAESFLARAEPDFVLLQCGADSIAGDPIADLELTCATHAKVTRTLCQVADTHCMGRLLALGGGGYDLDNIARTWNAVVEALVQSTYA